METLSCWRLQEQVRVLIILMFHSGEKKRCDAFRNLLRIYIYIKFSGADVGKDESAAGTKFRYPSYVQDIMGDIFSLGFGPFRYNVIYASYIFSN